MTIDSMPSLIFRLAWCPPLPFFSIRHCSTKKEVSFFKEIKKGLEIFLEVLLLALEVEVEFLRSKSGS